MVTNDQFHDQHQEIKWKVYKITKLDQFVIFQIYTIIYNTIFHLFMYVLFYLLKVFVYRDMINKSNYFKN